VAIVTGGARGIGRHYSEALAAAGSACPFTTAYPAWILLENMAAWHDQAFATHENGMDGGEAELAFNGRLMVRWIAMMASWQKAGYFSYSGRGREGEARFASGECAVLTAASSSYAELRGKARFDLGVAHLPRVLVAVKADETDDPADIGLLGTDAVVADPDGRADLLEEWGAGLRRWSEGRHARQSRAAAWTSPASKSGALRCYDAS